jgi:hypothetical protein
MNREKMFRAWHSPTIRSFDFLQQARPSHLLLHLASPKKGLSNLSARKAGVFDPGD